MNIISKKSTIFSLALAGLIAGSMPTTVNAALSSQQRILVFVGLGSLFATACKEAVAKPSVVTWEDGGKVFQLQDLFTQKYWENVIHLINDGYLGQAGIRGKAVLGITNEEDGAMTFKEVNALPSTGICGNTLFVAKLLSKKAKDICALVTAATLMNINFEHIWDGIWDKVKTEPAK